MNRHLQSIQPAPDVATIVATVLVSILTLISLTSTVLKRQSIDSEFKDQNGTATVESQKQAQAAGKSACFWGVLVSSVGLAVTAADIMRETPVPLRLKMNIQAINMIFWVLLATQVARATTASTCVRRYQVSRSVIVSSTIAASHGLFFVSEIGTLNTALLLFLGATLACVPNSPIVYLGHSEVVNRHGASFLSWVTFSYSFLHRKSSTDLPQKLNLHHVPALDSELRAKALHNKFRDVGKGANLWLQLGRPCLRPLLLQWSFVLLKSLSEFGSRYALFNLLRCLENNVRQEAGSEPWQWVAFLFSGLLLGTVADAWLLWITAGVLYGSLESALQTLVLEKFMRKEVASSQSEDADAKSGQKSPAGNNAMFKDTHSIARAVLDNYYFPMAALKILLDVFYLARLLSVKSLAAGALFPVITMLLSKNMAQKHQALQRVQTTSQRKTTAYLTEMLQNLHHIRLSSLERFWSRRLRESIEEEQTSRWATTMALEKLNFFSNIGPILLASVAISVHALESGSLSPAVAFTALSFFSNLQGVFAQLPAKAATLHKSWISMQELQQYLQEPEQTLCSTAAEELFLEEASLAWPDTLGKTENDPFALTGVTLRFPRNALSVITGKVGSGKSLLLAALLEEATVTAGRCGRPKLGALGPGGIVAGSTAYVSQPPWIDNCSIRGNIIFGYPFHKTRYETVISACALGQDLAALGGGDMTVAGAGGAALSGGQKWRVALARALYSPTETLILEDVLGAVDTPIAAWICEHALTGEIVAGRTVILATHRPEFCIAAASYTITIDNGTAVGQLQNPVALAPAGSVSSSPKKSVARVQETKAPVSPSEQPERPPAQPQTSRSTLKIIMFYLRLAGIGMYLFGVFMTICQQILSAGHTWWLTRWTSSEFGESGQHAATFWNVCLYILLSALGVLALAAQSLVFATVGMAASRSLYQYIVQRVLGATLLWIDSTPFGELFDIIDTDMHVLDNLIAPALNGIFATILQLGVIIVVSLYSNAYTAVSSIVILAIYAYVGPSMVEPIRRLRGLLGPAAHPVTDHKNAMVLGLTTIRAFGRTQLFMDRFYALLDNSSKVGTHIQIASCWTTMRSGLIGCAFVTATAAAMVYNNIDAATTGFTITMALQMRATLGKLLSQISMIRMGLLAVDRVVGLTEIPSEVDDGREIPDWPSRGALQVDAISMKYGPDLPAVLKDVSFSASSAERIGIVGRTGAGKSSLTNALLRFIELADGNIRIDGVSTTDVALCQLRSVIKIIPQEPLLFSGTLRSNLDPDGDQTDDDLVTVLQRVRLLDNKGGEALPGASFINLDMEVKSGGSNFSHGQRQLICLARAILAQCRILVLDESMSGMDNTTDEVIQQIIQEEFSATTVIVVAHKLLTVAAFDRILVMSQGEICEAGTPAELLAKQGVFADMVRRSGTQSMIEAAIKHKR